MTAQEIRDAIAQGRVDKAIKGLQVWAEKSGDIDLQQQAIQLAARWNSLRSQEITGVLSNSEAGIERNKIVTAILALTTKDTTGGRSKSEPEPSQPSRQPVSNTTDSSVKASPDTNVSNPEPSEPRAKNNLTAVIIGVIFVAIAALLAILIKCPTTFQYWVFMVVLALGAALLAFLVSGSIKVVKANGAEGLGGFAVFILILFLQPLQFFSSDEGCNGTDPFTMTLALQPEKPNPKYPDYDGTVNQIQVWTGNEYRTGDVNANGVVDFKNMPPPILDHYTEVRLLKPETSPWALLADSVLVKPSGQRIKLKASGVLERVWGRVKNDLGNPLAGAIVSFRTFSDTTGTDGRFEFMVPENHQQSPYPVEVYAPDYKTKELDAYSHSDLNVALEKK